MRLKKGAKQVVVHYAPKFDASASAREMRPQFISGVRRCYPYITKSSHLHRVSYQIPRGNIHESTKTTEAVMNRRVRLPRSGEPCELEPFDEIALSICCRCLPTYHFDSMALILNISWRSDPHLLLIRSPYSWER